MTTQTSDLNLRAIKQGALLCSALTVLGALSACNGKTSEVSSTPQHVQAEPQVTEQNTNTPPVNHGRLCIDHLVNAPLKHFSDEWILPPEVIDLRSEEGQRRLLECSHCDDYPALATSYLTQATQTFCGLASTVMVLNADGESRKWRPITQPYKPFHFYTQCNLLNDDVKADIDVAKILNEGMELNEIFFVLERQPSVESAYCRHATNARAEGEAPSSTAPQNCGVDESYETFMDTITTALDTPRHYIIANFAGAPSPSRGGHFSPIAAYHKASDSFLIMDVARYKYPPFWIASKKLWQGMQTIDSGSGRARGYIITKTKSSDVEISKHSSQ